MLQTEHADSHQTGAGVYGQGSSDGFFHNQASFRDAGNQPGPQFIGRLLSLAVQQGGQAGAAAGKGTGFRQQSGESPLCAAYFRSSVIYPVIIAGDDGLNV